MTNWQNAAVIASLISKLKHYGSWCGETHVQKAAYVAKTLLEVPVEEEFILYKHGPFSFELRDTLSAMRADQVLSLTVQGHYGVSYSVTDSIDLIDELFGSIAKKFDRHLEFVAQLFDNKGVSELERLSTALYVTRELGESEAVSVRAERLVQLKRHISQPDAINAIGAIDEAIADVKQNKLLNS